jgi:hydrogenase maturation protease
VAKSIRVIGIGSPVPGDTLGMELVAQLRDEEKWRRREEIEWLLLERPGAALLQYLDGVETVCLVDALEGHQIDGVLRIDPDSLLSEGAVVSSHHFGVAEALQLAAALQRLPPRLLIYGIAGESARAAQLGALLAHDLTA